ncbi:MAG: hypothetical protein BWY19_00991 [bacterium ADurb.Bin212]|jgi:hypothetical protein|nr:MAG: hypothetical protein BWY19_00991 [bacterium ADurb.Bin212]
MKYLIKLLTAFSISICVYLALIFVSLSSIAQEQKSVELVATIQQSMAILISDTQCDFGIVIAGTPSRCQGGFDISVKTNSSTGYLLGAQDNVADPNSAMVYGDAVTHIPDFSAPLSSPEIFDPGVDIGVGITVYAADTNKELKWGNGSSYNDLLNKYAGIPELMQTLHSSPNYKADFDNTSVAFIMDVSPDQKDGFYSGNVIITAVALVE